MTTPKSTGETVAAQRKLSNARLRRALFETVLNTDRGYALKRRQRMLLKQLMAWVNPLTGHLRHPTMNSTLERELGVSTRTLARARRELIEAGLIIGYTPGDGRHPGRYTLARSWEEADEAAVERRRESAPYFPPNPQRVPEPRPAAPERTPTAERPTAPRRRPAAAPAAKLDPNQLPSANGIDVDPVVHAARERERTADPRISPENPARLAAQAAARDAARRVKRGNAPPQTGGRPAA